MQTRQPRKTVSLEKGGNESLLAKLPSMRHRIPATTSIEKKPQKFDLASALDDIIDECDFDSSSDDMELHT